MHKKEQIIKTYLKNIRMFQNKIQHKQINMI